MRNRGRGRRGGRLVIGQGRSGPDAAHTIISITDDGGAALATTAAPHGLVDGISNIVISGNSVAGYNLAVSPVSVSSPTTFLIGIAYISDGFGGQWVLA